MWQVLASRDLVALRRALADHQLPICVITHAGKKLSENCKRELQNFKMEQAENVNANVPLGKP